EAVVGQVGLAAHEPAGVGLVPLQHLAPALEPVERLGGLAPEALGVLERLAVEALVLLSVGQVGLARERLGRLEATALVQHGVDAGLYVGHGSSRARAAASGRSGAVGRPVQGAGAAGRDPAGWSVLDGA